MTGLDFSSIVLTPVLLIACSYEVKTYYRTWFIYDTVEQGSILLLFVLFEEIRL